MHANLGKERKSGDLTHAFLRSLFLLPCVCRFKDNVRAVLYPTGYILVPLRDQAVDVYPLPGSAPSAPIHSVSELGSACMLTFVTQMDRESVLIVSPDLLGETNELRQTFNNIKACLARDYGLRTLVPSAHTQQLRAYAGRMEEEGAAGTAATHSRTPSVPGSYHPTPITYKQRHTPAYDDNNSNDADGRSNNSRNNSAAQPSPPSRGLPVIPEKR